MSGGGVAAEQVRSRRTPWHVGARARAMELAEAQVTDAEIERTLRYEFQPDYKGRPTPSRQDLARRARRVAVLMKAWASQLDDARACGRAKLQARLVAIAQRDGPGTTQAATFLAREHTSIAELDRGLAEVLKRFRSLSPRELLAEAEAQTGRLRASLDGSVGGRRSTSGDVPGGTAVALRRGR